MPAETISLLDDSNIVKEEVVGLTIHDDGTWSKSSDEFDSKTTIVKVVALKGTVLNLKKLITGDTKIAEIGNSMIAEQDNTQSFDENGTIPNIKFKCPQCGKEVEKLLKNGYCSSTCAMRARAAKAQKKVSDSGEKVLAIIEKIKGFLKLLDLALNVVTLIPDILREATRLPEEYREYVIMQVEIMFMELKKIINSLEIRRNEYIIQLMSKMKNGVLDDKLSVIIAPINTVISVVIAMQEALNVAVAAIMALLQNPMFGSIPPNGGHGFALSAKSFQHPQTAGKIFVVNNPQCNIQMGMKSIINVIDVQKIEEIIRKVMPPIQPVEYFMDPTAFKVRWMLSPGNAGLVKKLIQMLEYLTVQCAGECFPRYKNLSLIRPFFVLAIFTGWGPLTRVMFGDFIFHATI